MTTVTMRSYAGEHDLKPLVDLINACEEADRLDAGTTLAELRLDLGSPELDQQRDVCLWQDDSGALIAFAMLWNRSKEGEDVLDGNLRFGVHPALRSEDLEDQIMRWATDRLNELAELQGVRTQLYCGVRNDDSWRTAVVQRHGLEPVRYFLRMVRALDEPISAPQLPEGFVLRSVTGEHDLAPWVELYNESFIDHWNHHTLTLELAGYLKHNDPFYDPAGDLVAVAPDGTMAAFCLCHVNPEENARSGRRDGWISLLGTRRGFRKLGLGKAMLLAGLMRLKSLGLETARLGVDAASPTGATRLYESVGFQADVTTTAYCKQL